MTELKKSETCRMNKLDRHYSRIIDVYDEKYGDKNTLEKVVTDKRHEYIERERES